MSTAVTPQQLSEWIQDPQLAGAWISKLGVEPNPSVQETFALLDESPLAVESLAEVLSSVAKLPPDTTTERGLVDYFRILSSPNCPDSLATTLVEDNESCAFLMRALGISPQHSDWLTSDPTIIENLLNDAGQPTSLEFLCDEALDSIQAASGDFDRCVAAIQRLHRRESLRIVQGDLLNQQRYETVAEQNAFLAQAVLRAAVAAAEQIQKPRLGTPPESSRFVVVGLGSLGGGELDYSGHLELAFLYDLGTASKSIGRGKTTGPKSVATADYYQRVTETVFALLREAEDQGLRYQVNIRNATSTANVAMRTDDAWKFYDTHGETWDRLNFIKARPIAGDMQLGNEFLAKVESTVYCRYLNQVQIASIKTFRRKFDRAVNENEPGDFVDGAGGIVDVELVTQFLQLISGGDLPEIRVPNTLKALGRLKEQGCLTDDEALQLTINYIFLRTVQHRLQIIVGPDQSRLPSNGAQLLRVAQSVELGDEDGDTLVAKLKDRVAEATAQNHTIVRRLSFDAFGADESGSPIVDLILNPSPRESVIESVLQPYGFRDGEHAYKQFMSLATEKIPFLSKLRCRHFLASIAPKLLPLIERTPDADGTLAELDRVSDSLGGKGALWELFHSHPALMELYVRLCAGCPYLSGILVQNPGMIDALMDSLMLMRLPNHEQLANEATSLCRGAEDIEPILHGFKNANHLSVGVRDIWGKDEIRATTETLADIAEVCLQQVILSEYEKLVPRLGIPTLAEKQTPTPSEPSANPISSDPNSDPISLPQDEGDCELVVLGLGKLGGREPNYHSNLEVLFVYEADGQTRHPARSRNRETTSNQHFFSELAQRVTRVINRLGPWGRLYEIDTPFSTGRTKVLSISQSALCEFVAESSSVSHRQLLCKARPIFGSHELRARTISDLHTSMQDASENGDLLDEIRSGRQEMEKTASPRNLKRAVGGTVDIETIVQMLQLRHAATNPKLLVPGTLEAIESLHQTGVLDESDAEYLMESYSFLRSVEARLRLMDTVARHDLPSEPSELNKLAFLLNLESGKDVEHRCDFYRSENRKRFDRLFAAACR